VSSLADRLKAKFARVERSEIEVHAYQWSAADFLFETPFSALFIDTGLGKTVIVLLLLVRLFMSFACKKVLIIAPVRVAAQTWPNEIQFWDFAAFLNWTVIRAEDDDPEVISAGKAAYDDARYFGGDPNDARKALQKARTAKKAELRLERARSRSSVHMINKEALPWLVEQYTEWNVVKGRRKRRLVNWPYDVVIIDESSCVKAYDSALFNALQLVRHQGAKRMHQLTATPAAESYEGLFTQTYLMDLGERLGRNITSYRKRFMQPHPHVKFKWRMNPGADKQIAEIISDIVLVMKSEDYLDEQEPLFLPRKIDLTPAEQAMYRKFQREFVLTLPEKEERIVAETAASLSSKLLQLASGAVYDENKKPKHVHDHKIDDLRQLVEELDVSGEPLMVAYWYKSSLARLKKAFPDAKVMDKAGKMVDPWNAGKVKMLLVHPASVGHGLNMQKGPGHDIYFFDACWSYELYYQLYRRLHRQGQARRVRVHLAQVVGTVDELVFKRLLLKRDAQEALFQRIKALRSLHANDNRRLTLRKAA
jgi:hypothetical protein